MSSAADIEVWNSATQAFDSGSLEEAINQFMSMGTISAKISFNIGSALLAQENIKDALENFQLSVKKDSHLAVGYYMCGLCFYKESRFTQANDQFEQTLKCMRGNKCVDYKQLGLRFQLYECEVLLFQAAIQAKLDNFNKAKYLLSIATDSKVEKKHDVLNDAIISVRNGRVIGPIMPLSGAVFRPPAQAVKNLKKKDYLGQAKVLYTADPKDNISGFSGLKLIQETRDKVLADIRVPGRKDTLRHATVSNADVNSRPKPPRKALPHAPEGSRQRIETWAGSKPSKPLPMAPRKEPPRRSCDSPPLQKGWDGQKSSNSAFIERSKSPLGSNTISTAVPPRKPLPSHPSRRMESSSSDNAAIGNGGNNNQVEIKVQLNLSLKIDCNEHLSLEDFQERIRRQAASKSVEMRYTDGLGKEKRLTEQALDHITQGSIENPKIQCFSL